MQRTISRAEQDWLLAYAAGARRVTALAGGARTARCLQAASLTVARDLEDLRAAPRVDSAALGLRAALAQALGVAS